MKQPFLLILNFLFIYCNAQTYQQPSKDAVTNKLSYYEVVPAKGTTAKDLYNKALKFMNEKPTDSSTSKLTLNEKNFELIQKVSYPSKLVINPERQETGTVFYTLKITAASNSYQYIITNLVYLSETHKHKYTWPFEDKRGDLVEVYQGNWNTLKQAAYNKLTMLIAMLKVKMSSSE